jgi:hypothetical protein
LAANPDADDAERLAKLVELSQLTDMAAAKLRDFTLELRSLIDHLAAAQGKRP